jgi:hypothetical protein
MRGTKRISLRRKQQRSMVNQENSSRNISILQKYTFQDGDVDDPKVSGYYRGIAFHRYDIFTVEQRRINSILDPNNGRKFDILLGWSAMIWTCIQRLALYSVGFLINPSETNTLPRHDFSS